MSDTKEQLKELTESQLAIFEKNTRVTKRQGDFEVWLDVDQQHFRLAFEPEGSKHAEWYQRQLAIALERMINTRKEPSTAETIEWATNKIKEIQSDDAWKDEIESAYDASAVSVCRALLAHLKGDKEQ